jgi:hypothetical protein
MTELTVALAEVVLRKVCSVGCTPRTDHDTAHSYAFSCRLDPANPKERLFFIPRELTPDGGYTQAQLDTIEQTLAHFGFDLLPLDPYLH